MSAEKIRILGITGPSGCGKDTAARYLAETFRNYFYYSKLFTTRPQRNEDDIGYYFVDSDEFLKQVIDGRMLNAQEFRGWYYGLSRTNLVIDRINVLPMNNEMIFQMKEENLNNYDLKIVYISTNDKQRLTHILEREKEPDCYEICRRFITDQNDYIKNNQLLEYCNYYISNNYNNDFYVEFDQLFYDKWCKW